ncbi:MAG: hypothetical protein ACK559_20000 [bacterium]
MLCWPESARHCKIEASGFDLRPASPQVLLLARSAVPVIGRSSYMVPAASG